MSNVWETRHRLLLEQCEALVDWLSGNEPIAQHLLEEQTVRLLMGVAGLLRQHQVSKRGRCAYCGWARWGWRFWRRRPQCTVFRIVDLAMGQGLDVVWWQLFAGVGREASLEDVREWVAERMS